MLQVQITGFDKIIRSAEESQKISRKEIAKSINKVSKVVYNKYLIKDIRKNINKPTSYVKKYARFGKKANASRLEMNLFVKYADRPSLIEHKAKESGNGITYDINGRKRIKDAFIADARFHRGKGVFRRRGSQRLPIIELKGVSIWGVVVKNNIDKKIKRHANRLLVSEFSRHTANNIINPFK